MLLDILFPKFCVRCNKIGAYICQECKSTIGKVKTQKCPYCYTPAPDSKTHERCTTTHDVDGLYSIFYYTGLARKVMSSAKYGLMYELIKEMLAGIDLSSCAWLQKSVLQPIPLHTARFKRRGFNQAEVLADLISKKTNVLTVNVLTRVKNTLPQAQIRDRKERLRNIHDAFQLNKSLQHKNIVLIDDLFTSGATTKEATKVLKENGATNVYVLTLFQGKSY